MLSLGVIEKLKGNILRFVFLVKEGSMLVVEEGCLIVIWQVVAIPFSEVHH